MDVVGTRMHFGNPGLVVNTAPQHFHGLPHLESLFCLLFLGSKALGNEKLCDLPCAGFEPGCLRSVGKEKGEDVFGSPVDTHFSMAVAVATFAEALWMAMAMAMAASLLSTNLRSH